MISLNHARMIAFTGGDGISDGATPGAELKLLVRDGAGLGKGNDTSTDDSPAAETKDPATVDSGSISTTAPSISLASLESAEPTSVESVAVPPTTASLSEPISTDSPALAAAPSTSPESVPSTTTDSAAAAPSTVLPSASASSSDPTSAPVSDSTDLTPSITSDPVAAATSSLTPSSSSDPTTVATSSLVAASSSDPAAAPTSTLASSSASDTTSEAPVPATSSASDLSPDITSALSSTLAPDATSASASDLASSTAIDTALDTTPAPLSAAPAGTSQVISDTAAAISAAPIISDSVSSNSAASDPAAPNSVASPPTASTTAKPAATTSVSPSVSELGVSASKPSKSVVGSEQATVSSSSSNSISKPIFSEFQQGLAPTAAAELGDPTSFLTATRTGQSGVFINPSADPTNAAGFNVTQINRPTGQVNATIAASVIGAVAGIIGIGILVTFIIRRYFRAHRLGKAESPPPSPLLRGLNSSLPGSTRDNLSWLNSQRADHGGVGGADFDEKEFMGLNEQGSPLPGMTASEGGGGVEVRGWRALSLFPTRGKAAEGRVVPHDF